MDADVLGYENTHSEPTIVGPPRPSAPPVDSDQGVRPAIRLPQLTEEDVKEALTQRINEGCCYGKKPLRHLVVRSIEPACTYHYRLDSFMEQRLTAWAEEPWDGGPIDGSHCGRPPQPWEVVIYHPTGAFKNSQAQTTVPHTSKLVVCAKCTGGGRKPCTACAAFGRIPCSACQGTGRQQHHHHDQHEHDHHHHDHHHHQHSGSHTTLCIHCNGTAHTLCKKCNGLGQCLCGRCKGKGQVKKFIRLTAIAKNYADNRVLASNHPIPANLLVQDEIGMTVYEEENHYVHPISTFPDARIVHESHNAIANIHATHPQETMLRQRQVIKAVPITEVVCTYKNETAIFYVYGMNNKVFFSDGFEKWFSCCTIL